MAEVQKDLISQKIDEFAGKNSSEKEEIKRVAKGNVRKKEESRLERFASEHLASIASYVLKDYIIPTAKDAIISCVEIALYGETKKKSRSRSGSYVNYSGYSSSSSTNSRTFSMRDRARHNLDNIFFDDKRDADEVLDQLLFLCEKYGAASVRDFCELAGVEQTHTDEKYGWVDLRSARVRHTRDGWIIDMERPYLLD